MYRRNRREQLVLSYSASRQGAANQLDTLRNQTSIPQPAVLPIQRYQLAVRTEPRRKPRLRQEHEREKPRDSASLGNFARTIHVNRIASTAMSARSPGVYPSLKIK